MRRPDRCAMAPELSRFALIVGAVPTALLRRVPLAGAGTAARTGRRWRGRWSPRCSCSSLAIARSMHAYAALDRSAGGRAHHELQMALRPAAAWGGHEGSMPRRVLRLAAVDNPASRHFNGPHGPTVGLVSTRGRSKAPMPARAARRQVQ